MPPRRSSSPAVAAAAAGLAAVAALLASSAPTAAAAFSPPSPAASWLSPPPRSRAPLPPAARRAVGPIRTDRRSRPARPAPGGRGRRPSSLRRAETPGGGAGDASSAAAAAPPAAVGDGGPDGGSASASASADASSEPPALTIEEAEYWAAEGPPGANVTAAEEEPADDLLSEMSEEELKINEEKLKEAVREVKEAAKEVAEKAGTLKKNIKVKLTGNGRALDNGDYEATSSPSYSYPAKKKVEGGKDGEPSNVRGAVAEVTESAGKLTGKIVGKGPSIMARVFLGLFSKEIREDFKRRRAVYVSDWVDAFKNKRQTIPAILFLYFACLAPAVSFGTISSELTNGSIGVVEFLLSSGCSGMVYAVLCGQPMAFIAPTGLTLAFISGLFRFCSLKGIPFFPVYTWVGLWTSLYMVSLGMAGSSKLIRFCTRFTDEVFNGLLSLNFIYEALSSLRRNFRDAPDPSNLTMPFVALSMALGTFYSTMKVTAFQTSKFFNKRIRTIIKDFGPVAILAGMSILNLTPAVRRFNVPTLGSTGVPSTFQLSGGREFLVPLNSISVGTRLLCALPAVLLTGLFFMDQNISVRVVNNPDNGLKKGPAYNLDMVALGLITAGLSVVGLPWMCGATVQSLNHLRAMTSTHFNEETQKLDIESVTETRFTGFTIHALIAATIGALPLLSYLPIPVVSGVFLFLGRKLMSGNNFLQRIGDGIAERRRLPRDHPVHLLGRKKMNLFTWLQVACLIGLWTFKQNPSTAIFFPSVIAMLMVIRSFILPRFFSEEELVAMGDPTPT